MPENSIGCRAGLFADVVRQQLTGCGKISSGSPSNDAVRPGSNLTLVVQLLVLRWSVVLHRSEWSGILMQETKAAEQLQRSRRS